MAVTFGEGNKWSVIGEKITSCCIPSCTFQCFIMGMYSFQNNKNHFKRENVQWRGVLTKVWLRTRFDLSKVVNYTFDSCSLGAYMDGVEGASAGD